MFDHVERMHTTLFSFFFFSVVKILICLSHFLVLQLMIHIPGMQSSVVCSLFLVSRYAGGIWRAHADELIIFCNESVLFISMLELFKVCTFSTNVDIDRQGKSLTYWIIMGSMNGWCKCYARCG
jgi:hypothetical protein